MSVIIQARYFDTSPQRKQGGFPLLALRACTTPVWALTLILAFCHPATSAEKSDPEAYVKVVAPFIDEQTLIVAHADLSRVEPDAVRAFLESLPIPVGFDAEQKEEIKKELKKVESAMIQWLTPFRKAGGKEIFALVSLADFPGPFPLFIVTLGPGADAASLERLLPDKFFRPLPPPPHPFPLGPESPGGKIKMWRINNILFIGPEKSQRGLNNLKPVQRPGLTKGFAAAGDTLAQVILLPPPHMYRIISEVMPEFPPEARGGSTQVLTKGVQWAALGLELSPKMPAHLVIQAQDSLSAQALNDCLKRLVTHARGYLVTKGLNELQKWIYPPGTIPKEISPSLRNLDSILAQIKLRLEEDRLVLSMGHNDLVNLFQPLILKTWEDLVRQKTYDNMRQLTLGFYRYAEIHQGLLPAVAIYEKQGRPLLSWRVLLLPYLGEKALYQEFHLDEPWDSDHNKKLIQRMPKVFSLPRSPLNSLGKTVYLAPTGKGLAFEGTKGIGLRDILDGTMATIFLVEVDDAHAVTWTKPEDLAVDLNDPRKGLGRHFGAGSLVGFLGGSVDLVRDRVSKATLRAAFTGNGGEVMGPDW